MKVLYCKDEACKGPIKPEIVFFGEALPDKFRTLVNPDALDSVDLLIVMGTALAVSPFNMIPQLVNEKCPRVLFNLDNTDKTSSHDFTAGNNSIFVQGKCDETLTQLCVETKWSA